MTTRITKEQAEKLRGGITPGPWKTADAIGTYGVLCYERVAAEGSVHIADVWHADDYDFMPDRKARAANSSAIAAVPELLATIIAQDARIAELEARENEWRSAFWVADQFAVAIHDDAGKFYSIRARDFHRMSDLYRGNISETRAALNGERT